MADEMRSAIPALAGLLLAACGSTDVRVLEAPTRDLSGFGPTDVRPVVVRVRPVTGNEWKSAAEADAVALADELRERLADGRTGEPLVLEASIVRYESEHSEPKLWGGGGAMLSATIAVDVVLRDGEGVRVARFEAIGTSEKGGWAVATMNAARHRAVKAIVEFVRRSP